MSIVASENKYKKGIERVKIVEMTKKEIEENNKRSQFVELQYFYFVVKKYNYLKQIDCLEDSIMWKFIKLLSGNLPEEDQYLYKIITYKADNDIEDIFLFNESISDYKEFAFRSIEEALEFCFKKFGKRNKICTFVAQLEK